jgi:predicted transcriptional regulator
MTAKSKTPPHQPLPAGTNVRLDIAIKARLDRIAKRHGLKKADLIRNAVAFKLPEWEADGVKFQ